MIRLLSEADVRRLVTPELVLAAVEKALIALADGSGTVNPVIVGEGTGEGQSFAIKSGVARREGVVGAKIGSYWPQNQAFGLQPHGSAIALLDAVTGRLAAVIEANELNGVRTAAADVIAARVLARRDSKTLTVIGAGHQAESEARLLCVSFPFERLLIASRTASRALALRERLIEELDVDVEVTDLERGCREADVLVTVTTSRVPLFESRWIRPGTHIASMGSDQVGKQELPVDLLRQARLFCDLAAQSTRIGEFQHVATEIRSGSVALTPIGKVLSRQAEGRRSRDEITVFDSSGVALQDLFVAAALLDACDDERDE